MPWLNFLTYAVITAATPGPNNLMAMSSAGRVGFRRTLPFAFGMLAGFFAVMAVCTLLMNHLTALIPKIEFPMRLLGAAYMLCLAWKSLKSRALAEEGGRAGGFLNGFLLQFINPKIYVYCIVSMETYILPHYAGRMPQLMGFALILTLIGFVFSLSWAGFGAAFRLLFVKYAKVTNWVMALLLVYCAVALLI
jgi:threonine/homoserine/homoserine lactone efflux protein